MPNQVDIDIKGKFKDALVKLYQDDFSLIERRCSERSIVFRLGLYLAYSLADCGLDVDCEYNKNGDRPKALLERRFNFPDIIVHKRESNESNLLIAEVKTPNDTQPEHFQNDAAKLRGFTHEVPYSYKWGVHVYISATSCSLVWYARGRIQNRSKYETDRITHNLLQVNQNDLRKRTAFDRWYIEQGNIFE